MLSSYDLKSVVDMIERSSVSDYPYMKAHAHMDLAIIRNQCRDRTMSNKEESAAEFAIEIIIQLEKKEHEKTAGLPPYMTTKYS